LAAAKASAVPPAGFVAERSALASTSRFAAPEYQRLALEDSLVILVVRR
jgi:hypothetical protein